MPIKAIAHVQQYLGISEGSGQLTEACVAMRQLTAGQQLACDRRVKQDLGLFILAFKKQKNIMKFLCNLGGLIILINARRLAA